MIWKKFLFVVLLLAILATVVTSGCARLTLNIFAPPAIPIIPDAEIVGDETCAICHDDVMEYYQKTVHAKIRSFEMPGRPKGCEACHGPGSVHVEEGGDIGKTIAFSQMTPQESSEVCLQCHTTDPVMDWRGNVHITNDVGCNECHKSHKVTAKKMVYLGEPELCFTCHQDKRAEANFPSHHPIREGKMNCTSCHDNHGSENYNLKRQHINDICYNCHAEFQGPYVFEHAPVSEDCSICHDSHGSIANNLLRQTEPFLCLRCHRGHRGNPRVASHPSLGVFSGPCTQCHFQVHGSDLPSQMGGGALTR